MYLYALIIVFILGLNVLLIHAKRLFTVSIALAAISALTASIFYLDGASTVAVIELSVGAGLVAVLFTFANSLLAERQDNFAAALAPLLVFILVLVTFAILIGNGIVDSSAIPMPSNVGVNLWEERSADVLVLMTLMFSAVLSVSALLAEHVIPRTKTVKEAL